MKTPFALIFTLIVATSYISSLTALEGCLCLKDGEPLCAQLVDNATECAQSCSKQNAEWSSQWGEGWKKVPLCQI